MAPGAGARATESTAEVIAREAAGHPLFIDELVRHAWEPGLRRGAPARSASRTLSGRASRPPKSSSASSSRCSGWRAGRCRTRPRRCSVRPRRLDPADRRPGGLRRAGKADRADGGGGLGSGALLPSDPAGQERRRLPQPDAALVAFLPRRLLLQAPDRQGDPRAALRGADLPVGLCLGRVLRLHPPRQDGRGRAALRLVPEGLRRGELLRRDPGQRGGDPAGLRRGRDRHREPDGPAAGRDQRRPLPDPRRRRRARRPVVHQHGQDDRRPVADAVRDRGVLRPQPGGDVRRDARPRGGRWPPRRGSPRWSSPTTRASAWAGAASPRSAPPTASRPRTTSASSARRACATVTATTPAGGCSSGSTTSWASSIGWASPLTS